MRCILEISAYSVEWAITAAKAGAGRIELCDNISEGGTTPSFGMIRQTLENVKIPVLPIIRPRGGNFIYTPEEIKSMKDDIRMVKEAGAKGVVFGILDENTEFDIAMNRELLELARPMEVACHRAFDLTPDPEKSLRQLIEIGFDRVLTSGHKMKAEDGIPTLAMLNKMAGGKITIMPGAGVEAYNVARIARDTGTREFHLSAKRVNWEEPLNNRSDISFSAPGTRLFMIDRQKVLDMVEVLNRL